MKADNRDPRIAVWRTWPLPDGSRAEVYRVERQAPAAPRVEGGTMRVYLGTYTRGASRGIYVLEFDPSSGTWTSVPALAGQAENPSFLARHPSGRFLYAVNEVADFKGVRTGAVSAFAVEPATGRLTLVNQQPSEGANPCHITIDAASRNALVANYTSGTVAVLPIARDGGLNPASAVRRRIRFRSCSWAAGRASRPPDRPGRVRAIRHLDRSWHRPSPRRSVRSRRWDA